MCDFAHGCYLCLKMPLKVVWCWKGDISLLFVLQMQEFWSTGVLTAKTRCWAQGMDGWRPLQAIPQLKWCLMATGQAVMNESDLATLILNMLITMCSYYPSRWAKHWEIHPIFQIYLQYIVYDFNIWWICESLFVLNQCFLCFLLLRDQDNAIIRPLPKIKRMISDNACLPHIVQVKIQIICFVFFYSLLSVVLIEACDLFFFTAAFDLWPHFGGKGSKFAVLGDAGQP